jgi:hypothetical protein
MRRVLVVYCSAYGHIETIGRQPSALELEAARFRASMLPRSLQSLPGPGGKRRRQDAPPGESGLQFLYYDNFEAVVAGLVRGLSE